MRKSLIFLMFLSIVILLCCSFPVYSQVSSTYQFFPQKQYYIPDTSVSTTPAIFPDGWDDHTHTSYRLPFNFTYNGILYAANTATVGVDSDGWVAFSPTSSITMTGTVSGGSWLSASNSQGVYLSGNANDNGFCGLNGDIREQIFPNIRGDLRAFSNWIRNITNMSDLRVGMKVSGIGIPTNAVINLVDTLRSQIRISAAVTSTANGVVITPRSGVFAFTRGIAPFRQFVIQWTRTVRFSGPSGDDFSFQMILNEGGGVPAYQTLQTTYGNCYVQSNNDFNVQVGLRGSSASDINARRLVTTWDSSLSSISNRDTMVIGVNRNPSDGLTYTWTPSCLGIPANPGAFNGVSDLCPNTPSTINFNGVQGATYYKWSYSGTGVVFSEYTTMPSNSLLASVAATPGILTVFAFNSCGSSVSSSAINITIRTLPVGSISYANLSLCRKDASITPTITGSAVGGRFYAVPFGISIDSITGLINPANSFPGIYTVRNLFTSGCLNISSVNIEIKSTPSFSVSSNPGLSCAGASIQLQTTITRNSNYSVVALPYSEVSNSGPAITLWNTLNNDGASASIPIPFAFNFYGLPVNQVFANVNGYIQLQTFTGSSNVEQLIPNPASPNNIIAMAWDDLVVDPVINPGALVRYFISGVSPNRVLVFEYNNLIFFGGNSTQNVSGQIRLYELDQHIEISIKNVYDGGTLRTKTMGLENSFGTIAASPLGRNLAVWNTTNECWAFYPPLESFSYTWTPAANLNNLSISNPIATGLLQNTRMLVNVRDNVSGCSDTASVFVRAGVPISNDTLTGPTLICPNTTQTYSIPSVVSATQYNWSYSGTGASFSLTTASPSNVFNFSTFATPGRITVRPSNVCGNGSPIDKDVIIRTIDIADIDYPLSICKSDSGTTVQPQIAGVLNGVFGTVPSVGLSIDTLTGIVNPGLSSIGTYIVTYTYNSNTCRPRIGDTLFITSGPVVNLTATPATMCIGDTSLLLANITETENYTVESIPYNWVNPTVTPVNLWTTYVNDANSAAINLPFSFTYYKNPITRLYINSDGHIQLQTPFTPANARQQLPNAGSPNNIISMAWDDLVLDPSTNPGALVRYFTQGVAPNRVFVVEYKNLRFLSFVGVQNVTGQIRLYEIDSHIEIAIENVNDGGTLRAKTLGIENNLGTLGITPFGRNNVVWNTSNEAWAFYPPQFIYKYTWTPPDFLSSDTIINPIIRGINRNTTYFFKVANLANGCSDTASILIKVGIPDSTGAISGSTNICANSTQTYSIPVVLPATSYAWSYSGTGATFPAITNTPTNSINFSVNASSGVLTVTPLNICGNGTSSSLNINVISTTPTGIQYPYVICKSNSTPITPVISGVGAGVFSVTPSSGFTINSTTGVFTGSANPVGNFIVRYTYSNSGCSLFSTDTFSIVNGPALSSTATPNAICFGSPSQLQATISNTQNYTALPLTFRQIEPTGTPTIVWNTAINDANSSAIVMPFPFVFYGNTITQLFINSNGHIQLQNGIVPSNVLQTIPNGTTPNNIIALAWDDLILNPATNPGASVRYFTEGVSPNRIFIVDYINLSFFNPASNQNVTGQIRLYEIDNHIEIAAKTVNDGGLARWKTMGIENSNGTLACTPTGRNGVSWNTSNESWGFYSPQHNINYSWTPVTALSNPTINNPVVNGSLVNTTTYTVTASNSITGCSASSSSTVSVTSSMSGTYTIGAGGNYTTLTAAVNDYNTRCITGPITFLLTASTYTTGEVFPISILPNAYQNSINTLVIKPATGVTSAIRGIANNGPLIRILGNYITIDGSNSNSSSRDLTINNTSLSSPRVVLIGSIGTTPVLNTTLKNCIVTNGAIGSTTIVLSDATNVGNPGYFRNINIINDSIGSGTFGIYVIGVVQSGNGAGILIEKNSMQNSGTTAIGDYGIYVQGIDSSIVTKNIIGNIAGKNAANDIGIWVGTGVRNCSIFGNQIYSLTAPASYGAFGMLIATDIVNNKLLVYNNMISNITGGGNDNTNWFDKLRNPTGILLNGSQSGISIYNNSINLFGATLNYNNALAACIRLENSTAMIRNNILVNKMGRLSGATSTGLVSAGIIVSGSSAQLPQLNNNNYFISPVAGSIGYCGFLSATGFASLAEWALATSGESAGINVNPAFLSNFNLRINPSAATSVFLSNRGTPISDLFDDFDLQTRDGANPDVGADEWNIPNTTTWVGRLSTDWTNEFNWAANVIPDLNTNVFINGGYAFMPMILESQSIRNLTLTSPVLANSPILTVNGGILNIYGTIVRTGGKIAASNGTITLSGSVAQTIPSGLFLENEVLNFNIENNHAASGVTLLDTLEVLKELNFSASTGFTQKLNTNGFLVLRSTRLMTASLGKLTSSQFINGDVTVERYIPTDAIIPGHHAKSWQHLAVPVNGQTIKQSWQEGASTPNANPSPGYGTQITGAVLNATSPAIGFDVYTPSGGASVKSYNSSNNTWTFIPNTTNTPSYNQKGYMAFVRGDRSVINFSGANSQAKSTVLRSKGLLFTPTGTLPSITTIAPNKLESIGNPYASAIEFTQIIYDGPPSILNKFWIWDPTLNTSTNFGGWQLLSPTGTGDFTPVPGGTVNYPAGVVNSRLQSGQAFFMMGGTLGGTVEFTEDAKVSGSANTFRQPLPLVNRQSLAINLFNASQQLADGVMVVWDRRFTNGIDIEDAIKIMNPTENLGIHSFEKLLTLESRSAFQNRDSIQLSIKGLKNQSYSFRINPKNFSSSHSFELFLVDRFTGIRHPLSYTSDSEYGFTVSSSQVLSANEFRFYIIAIKKKAKRTVFPVDPETKGNGLITKNGMDDINGSKISISPNPVRKGKLMFTIKNGEVGNHEIVVTDLMGNRVHSSHFESVDHSFQHSIQLTETLPTGVYILVIQNKNKIQKATFVVE